MTADNNTNPWADQNNWFGFNYEEEGRIEPVPSHCECNECGRILEAPLMVGSPTCCVRSLKSMLFKYVQRDYSIRGEKFDDDLARQWKGWCHLFVELCNTDPSKAGSGSEPLDAMDLQRLMKTYSKIIDAMDESDFE